MARVMYIECFSGAAGDMLLGALVDAGVPMEALRTALGSLGVDHVLSESRVLRSGIAATRIEVVPHAHHHAHAHDHPHTHSHGDDAHRSLSEIVHLIGHSALSPAGKARAAALFRRLGEAEAAIHNVPIDTIHFHEVGAVDSIIDICGVVFAMDWLGIDDVIASPMNVGGGRVEIAHGTFPVPAPATVLLLKGVPIYSAGPQVELTTPTGALLVSDYANDYGPAPAMTIDRVGYGAGARDFPSVPNVVRVLIGERTGAAADGVLKIECEIDDMNPQWFAPASDRLFEAGALDVFLTSVLMKKGRPGTLVTVLAPEARRQAVIDVLFRDTTTIGVRFESVTRETLDRRWVEVTTSGGPVRIKVAERAGVVLNAIPEFEDCLRIADSSGRPLKDVQAEALAAWATRVRAPHL
jgi:pyridinium-3,5-bisthiocarboxylic acid mononucleotide nickel chelatase